MKSSWLPTLEVSYRYLQVRKAGWNVLFGASHRSFPGFHFPSPPTEVMGAILQPLVSCQGRPAISGDILGLTAGGWVTPASRG